MNMIELQEWFNSLPGYQPPTDAEVASICRHVADQPDAATLLATLGIEGRS